MQASERKEKRGWHSEGEICRARGGTEDCVRHEAAEKGRSLTVKDLVYDVKKRKNCPHFILHFYYYVLFYIKFSNSAVRLLQ